MKILKSASMKKENLFWNPVDLKLYNQTDTDVHYAKILSQLGCKPQKITSKIIKRSNWWSLVFQSNFDTRDRNLLLPTYLWYYVSKIVATYFEKKLFLWLIKTFSNLRLKGKNFEITATIYSNSERSEKKLWQNTFLSYYVLEVSIRSNTYIGTNN